MIVIFEKEYLQELYVAGKASDPKHWYQPKVVSKYLFEELIEKDHIIATICNITELSNHYQ